MPDDLQRAIDETKNEVSQDKAHVARVEDALMQARHKLEIDVARLEALLFARSLRPTAAETLKGSSSTADGAPRKGRTPGSVSEKWKQILRDATALFPEGASETDFVEIAASNGIENMRAKDARQRMKNYINFGYVEQIGDRWKVTDLAINKFNLTSDTEKATPDQEVALTVSGDG